ncbi:hypothetical protein HMPREF1624_04567 [Sporothrix schenckii ATCC 58251]|uniref:C2H2-type domain-containing protein n=1 Tax=Sporothrix schenckii (strain ATCC 58251 / de Perez 2211183) TaxID=1391915 RepID=U7PUT6_SPOS1|nr:hypothetical protein HMPREF1624_04567 [Sporothrix schenckii ATCC 58251]
MDRMPSQQGSPAHGVMMPPPYANLKPAMVDYIVNSDDVPVGAKLHGHGLTAITSPCFLYREHPPGPASEFSAAPDSTYGTNSFRNKPSTGGRSLHDGSNATTLSGLAHLDTAIGGMQLDARSAASLPPSDFYIPATSDSENWTQGSIPRFSHMTHDDLFENAATGFDTTDMFSTPDINDSQSVNGTAEIVERHSFQNQNGFNCFLCPKNNRKVTKTRSEMINNDPLETDLAGMGLPSEPDITQSPALDTEVGSIDLHDCMSELNELMAEPFTSATWTSATTGLLLPTTKNESMATRLMSSKLRSIHPTISATSDVFNFASALPLSLPSPTLWSPQIPSSAPSLGHQRPSTFHSTPNPRVTVQLYGHPLQQRMNPKPPLDSPRDGSDVLFGTHTRPSFERHSVPVEPVAPKRDVHRAYADCYGMDAIRRMQTGPDPSPLLKYTDGTWASVHFHSMLAGPSKGMSPGLDAVAGAPNRHIQLQDDLSEIMAVETQKSSDGGQNDDVAASIDVVDAVVINEGDSMKQPQQPLKHQRGEEKSHDQDAQEEQRLKVSRASPTVLQETQEVTRDLSVGAESYIDLTVPDVESEFEDVDAKGPTDVDETYASAAVIDDIAFDTLSDDRLQAVLKRLKRLDDAGGRLKSLGFQLDEDGCSASFVSKASLRKHEKRHQRPYACTFSCIMKGSDAKLFGSKNDWKRHEEGLHFQEPVHGEEWQCGEMMDTVDENVRIPCCQVFKSAPMYRLHLARQHGYSVDDKKTLREKTARYRAVPAESCRYWCGFCETYIRVTARVQPASTKTSGESSNSDTATKAVAESSAANMDNDDDDVGKGKGKQRETAPEPQLCRDGFILFSEFLSKRFNHIDNHFVGRGDRKMNIAEWVPDDALGPEPNHNDSEVSLRSHRSNHDDAAYRKRHHGDDQLSRTKRSKSSRRKAGARFFSWVCCRCKIINTANSDVMCNDCQHAMCGVCDRE